MWVDRHQDQLKHIWANIKRFGVEVILILDFIHVLEYLSNTCGRRRTAFIPPGSESDEAWVAERAIRILKSQASAVAGGIRRSATLRGF